LQAGCPVRELAGNNRQVNERTDSDLLHDYAENGSESAFAELVNRHIALVYSAALRVVVDAHLAEDVTQGTFAILAKEARHLVARVFLSSWLHRTASNLASKLVRGEMRRRAREQEAYAMQMLPPESDPDWKRLAPLLDANLNELAEADRTVILLRFFEKKTAREIGSALKLSEEAAQKRVVRALNRLRGLLASQGVGLSTTTLAALITSQAIVAAPIGLTTSVSTAALVGGSVAGGITLTTLKLIVMSKLKVSAVSALVVAGVATPVVLQHQTVTGLREENGALREQSRQVNVLRGENEKLSGDLLEARRSQSLTRAQLSELLRLRGEVGPLRRDSQDLAQLRARQLADQTAAAPAQPAPHGDFIPAAAWANVGADKPEAGIQTFFWAGKHGETNLVGNLLRWQRDAALPASDELDQTFAQGLIAGTTRFAGSLQGFRVTSQEQERENEVRMGVELTNKDGKTTAHTLRLVREDDQWFPVMNVWLHEKGSVRAALDVPPKFEQPKLRAE
jgi:RNA polymerase sigma factor (sigma-70 family)